MTKPAAHVRTKSAFNTMLFELFGDKSFVETLLRFPVCSAAQPAEILTKFAATWKTRTDAVEYTRAQELSTPNPDKRLSLPAYVSRGRSAW